MKKYCASEEMKQQQHSKLLSSAGKRRPCHGKVGSIVHNIEKSKKRRLSLRRLDKLLSGDKACIVERSTLGHGSMPLRQSLVAHLSEIQMRCSNNEIERCLSKWQPHPSRLFSAPAETTQESGNAASLESSTSEFSASDTEIASVDCNLCDSDDRSIVVSDSKILVWLDLEMTGLDSDSDTILEIACIITSPDLVVVGPGKSIVISHTERVLAGMNSWSANQHVKSGLVKDVLASSIALEKAEQQMIGYIKGVVAKMAPTGRFPNRKLMLAGSCVHVDKKFLEKRMPALADLFNHRTVDVATIRELAKRWQPLLYTSIARKIAQNSVQHRALGDVKTSILELRLYKKHLFKGDLQL